MRKTTNSLGYIAANWRMQHLIDNYGKAKTIIDQLEDIISSLVMS